MAPCHRLRIPALLGILLLSLPTFVPAMPARLLLAPGEPVPPGYAVVGMSALGRWATRVEAVPASPPRPAAVAEPATTPVEPVPAPAIPLDPDLFRGEGPMRLRAAAITRNASTPARP